MVSRGFALVELAAVVVVAALLGVMLLAAGSEARRLARLGEDIAKLRQIGAWTGAYGADNSDLYWTFTWKKGQSLSSYPDLNNAATDSQAAANQAVDILRRRAGREDIMPITGWLPHVLFGHLIAQDYSRVGLPDLTVVSAANALRQKWVRDPAGFDAGLYSPNPGAGTNTGKRWPYSADFIMPAAFWDQSTPPNRVSQGATHIQYLVPSGEALGPGSVAATAFPASKVFMHDQIPRHFGPRIGYCTSPEARLPLLFADGAVLVRASADANGGWQPNAPGAGNPTFFSYTPAAWEGPTLSGGPSDGVFGRFRWTRGGIAGRDFDGPEICTGQGGCP